MMELVGIQMNDGYLDSLSPMVIMGWWWRKHREILIGLTSFHAACLLPPPTASLDLAYIIEVSLIFCVFN
jgi:hypothetical protein